MRAVFSCRRFDEFFRDLDESEKIQAKSCIEDWARGNLGKKITIKDRVVYRKKVTRGCRILAEVGDNGEIFLLFTGTHDEYDRFWKGKRKLPSIDRGEWTRWEIMHDAVAPVERDEESKPASEDYAYPAPLGTKSVLDNIVELTPSQKAIVQLNATGPVLICGVAGSGKTALGLHRAHHIAQQRAALGEDTSILMLTRTRALRTAIDWLAANSFKDLPIEVFAFGDWMKERLQESNPSISNISDSLRRENIRRIQTEVSESHPAGQALSNMSSSFILGEIDDVIRARDIGSFEEYFHVKRTGRRSGLNKSRRELVWIVYQRYTQALREQNLFDWAELPQLVLQHCRPLPRFDVVIVDEAQDLRPNYLNLAVKLVKDFSEHRSVTLLGDSAQSIQYQGVSWREARLPLRGSRTRVLRDNHRNSRQIINAALPILEKCRQLGNVRRYHSPHNIGKDGGKPVLVRYKSQIPVVKYIAQEIDRLSRISDLNLDYSNFAILSPRKLDNSDLFDALWRHLPQMGINCRHFRHDDFMSANEVGLVTMQSAAGLEFPVVFIIDFEEGTIPYRGPSSTPAEVIEDRARKLAYVSLTRATDRLYLVYREDNPSCFIEDILEQNGDAVEIVDL